VYLRSLISLALALGVSTPLVAQAQPLPSAPSQPMYAHHRPHHAVWNSLNLSADQKTKIRAILQQQRQASRKFRKDQRQQTLASIEAILTPEQRAQLQAKLAQRKQFVQSHRVQP
jgi:Spy/CpxP family protein refolding chaperone